MSDLKAAINAKDTTPTAGGQVPTAPETPKAAAPATTAPASPLASFKSMLEQMKPALNQALPKHINAERMSRIILTTFSQNPLLLQCTKESVIGSILVSAQLGLEIGQGTGEAYLVPFKRSPKGGTPYYECVLIAGYQGYIKLARQSGEIKSIFADAVHVGDDFVWKRSLDGDIFEHTPKFESEEITHFYALATFKSGGHALVCWPQAKVLAHALKHSKEKDWNAPNKPTILPKMWRDNFESMGCKTMIRQLFKWLPRSPEMQRAQEMDGAAIHANAKTGEIMDLLPTPHNDEYSEPEELQIDQETGEVING